MRRSVTLWVGLFILAFLFWAWWDSGRYCAYLEYSCPAWTLGVYSWDATLRCTLNTGPDAFVHGGFSLGHQDFVSMGRLPKIQLEQGSLHFDLEGSYREVRVAAWIVIMLYFNAWILLLLLSYVRRKNREAALAPPEPAPKVKSCLPFDLE